MEAALQTLHLYGAAGIAAFGWAMCRLIGCASAPWLPLWLAAALLFYNVDRLRRDPADCLNTPRREAAARRLRRWSKLLAAMAAVTLLALPLARRDVVSLVCILSGAAVCLNYSLPVWGFRLKDVPLLKTFFAPTLVIAAVFGLPLLHEPARFGPVVVVMILWAWGLLFGNMILCDLRDVVGDRSCGVLSLPAYLGEARAWRVLWVLVYSTCGLGLLLAILPPKRAWLWFSLAVGNSAFLGGLVLAARRFRSERFYEWWVEGILFVPAAVLALAGLWPAQQTRTTVFEQASDYASPYANTLSDAGVQRCCSRPL